MSTKKALLVGINDYPGTFSDLMGCVNDVENMSDLLTSHFGFPKENIVVITDRDATTLNMLKALEMLVHGAQPGDLLVFHYSGHGSQVPDTNGDESDHKDEVLCPCDFDWEDKVIRDDDLSRIFSTIPAGAHLEVILDCCHSGTAIKALTTDYFKNRFLPMPDRLLAACAKAKRTRSIKPANIQVLWAACKSNQSAADAHLDGKYCGAFTTILCSELRKSSEAKRKNLLTAVRKAMLKYNFAQLPQLEAADNLKKTGFLK